MKKLSAIFLFILFGGIAGRYILFTSYMSSQKIEFRNAVLSNQNAGLLKLKIANEGLFKNENGIEWQENNKELLLEGDFFEVVQIQKKADSCLVLLMPDLEENELFKNFFSLNTKTNKTTAHLLHFILSLVYIQNSFDAAFDVQQSKALLSFRDLKVPLSQFQKSLIKPPILFFI